LASAKIGDRVKISALPAEIRAVIDENADDMAEITSEFERDQWIMAIDASTI